MTLSFEDVKEIIGKVSFNNWKFYVGLMGDGYFVQVSFNALDTYSGNVSEQHGRKWYISPHSILDEVVRTCFLAVVTAHEHEIRESFTFNDRVIFGPHLSINKLLEVSRFINKRSLEK